MHVEEALKSSGIDRLDAEVLLAHAIGQSREWLIAHSTDDIKTEDFDELVVRRKTNEPVAYIVGSHEFYGRDFIVDSRVLIPRPSTERLVDLAIDFLEDGEDKIRELDLKIMGVARKFGNLADVNLIVDLCTGSGCIAVTLALETEMNIIATDISPKALEVAKQNASAQGVANRIDFLQGDLTEPLEGIDEPFIVVSNPPYIPKGEELMPDVANFEPHLALFSGADGSESVVKINNSLRNNPFCRGFILECRSEHVQNLE